MGVLDSQVQEMHLFDTSKGYSKHRSSYIQSLYAPQPCTLPPQTAIRINWDHAIAIFRNEKEKLRNVSTIYSPAYNACQSTCQNLQRTRNSASQKNNPPCVNRLNPPDNSSWSKNITCGPVRESNPGPLAPYARIMPLDQ